MSTLPTVSAVPIASDLADDAASAASTEPQLADWDETIIRAATGDNAEDKLVRTVQLLTAAAQRSRLRGDVELADELTTRLEHVHQLLDQL